MPPSGGATVNAAPVREHTPSRGAPARAPAQNTTHNPPDGAQRATEGRTVRVWSDPTQKGCRPCVLWVGAPEAARCA